MPIAHSPSPLRSIMLAGSACVGAIIAVGAVVYAYHPEAFRDAYQPGEVTGSVGDIAGEKGPVTGLPLPRFVSLKSDKVNVRKGPSSDHPVAWVFQRKGMPVEIVAEFENWRKIRDGEGQEGWILQQMLSAKRSILVMGYGDVAAEPLRDGASPQGTTIAQLAKGVTAYVSSCDGTWCEVEAGGHDGYVAQTRVWGVYPGEVVD